ncbi:glutaminase [Desulforhopalus sp. 52FAK]
MNQAIFDGLPENIKPYLTEGKVADYIPALGCVSPEKFGISATCVDGTTYQAGDSSEQFSLQSITKIFPLILALRSIGDEFWSHVGRRLSAKTFNAITPIEEAEGTPRNPFTNGGAIAIVDLLLSISDNYTEELLSFVQQLTGNNSIHYDLSVATSEKRTGHRNAAIALVLKSYNILKNEVDDVLGAYFTQCSLAMSCKDLSRAFLFLANHGLDPITGTQIITPFQSRRINALMLMFGTYDAAGDFVFRIGLPGKSGVGGGLLVIVPGKMTITVWSPGLDQYGTSVAGFKALELLAETERLSIL